MFAIQPLRALMVGRRSRLQILRGTIFRRRPRSALSLRREFRHRGTVGVRFAVEVLTHRASGARAPEVRLSLS